MWRYRRSMSVCSLCGYPTGDPGSVCRHHSADHGDDWARGNRLMCDLLHVSPPSDQLREKYCLRPKTKPLNGMPSAP